jgi:serine-type D-Ala-D-Ala carboxypeptidase (penicillin-binding protein 5/6)
MPIVVAITLMMSLGGVAPVASMRPMHLPMPPVVAFPAPPPPPVDAVAWLVYSIAEDAVIAAVNADRQLPQASITKLMTAILAVENADLSERVTISSTAGSTPIGFIGQPAAQAGEVWTVGELLEDIMVQSDNRAATALAEHVSGSADAFVGLMNSRAAELGMTSTVFRNPHGLDADGQVSTAHDLLLLGIEALRHPDVLRAARVKQVTFSAGGRRMPVTATNRDLGVYPGYFGLKTGDTARAGQVLLSYAETPRGGLLAVVLGSTNRRLATRDVITWGTRAYGPRDYALAAALATPAGESLPDWYRARLAGAGTLPSGDPTPGGSTPLTRDLDHRFRELLPELLGGGS